MKVGGVDGERAQQEEIDGITFWRWLVETPHKVDANLRVRLCGIRKETCHELVDSAEF